MEQECVGSSPEGEAWGLFSFPGGAQGLCCAHVLSPPGLLLLCEAVCTGVFTDPHGPVCKLSGNGFAGTAKGQGLLSGSSDLWDRVGISGVASSGELCSLLMEKQNCTEPSAAACPPWHAA